MEDGYLEGVPREVGTSEISGKSGGKLDVFFWGVRVENHSEYLSIQPIIQKTCIYIMIKNFGES